MKIWLWIVAVFLMQACATMPPQTNLLYQKIEVGYGPEDMVLQPMSDGDRFLVSCNTRRATEPAEGEIYAFDPGNDVGTILPRQNEPKGLVFNPHGIDLVCVDGKCFLYVISHDDEAGIHSIVKYRVAEDHLDFLATYTDKLLVSPNAVAAREDGSFFVTNDSRKRGNRMEALFKVKGSTVIYFDGENEWSVTAEKLSYANGIILDDQKAYVATTRQNHIYRYDIVENKFQNRKPIAKVVGGDNLRFDGKELIIPAHLRQLAFIGHVKKSENKSPTVVYRVSPESGEKEVIYCDDGHQISAGATGIVYKGHLYISQVFDPFILKVKL